MDGIQGFPYLLNNQIFWCPTLVLKEKTWSLKDPPRATYSYAIIAKDAKGTYSIQGYPKYSKIRNPADKLHVTDLAGVSTEVKNPYPNMYNVWFNMGGTHTRPHSRQSNFLWCDGHVDLRNPDSLTDRMFQSDIP